jgi:uncharacterized protein (TIGR02453 family)
MAVATFAGWPPEALEWFDGLAANNTKTWFHAHRETYDRAVRGPLEALLAGLEDEFGPAIVSRPNRDIRFAADKSPYKLQIYARVPHPESGGVLYVQLRREGLFVGGGLYMPERARLAAIRAAIADDVRGPELESIIADMAIEDVELMTDGALKTAPKGYARDHPRIELLRLPHLAAGTMHDTGPWLHTPDAERRVVDGWETLTPLLAWLASVPKGA